MSLIPWKIVLVTLLSITTLILGTFNQVYAVTGFQSVTVRNGYALEFRCPDLSSPNPYLSITIRMGAVIIDEEGNVRDDVASSTFFALNRLEGGILKQSNGKINDLQVVDNLYPPREIILRGVMIQDQVCMSQVPTDVTIRVQCTTGRITFESERGHRGEFGGNNTYVSCLICPPGQAVDWSSMSTISRNNCLPDPRAIAIMNSTNQSASYQNSERGPGDVDSSVGQVERDDIPQPQGDYQQQIKPNDDDLSNAEDTSSSNNESSKDTK